MSITNLETMRTLLIICIIVTLSSCMQTYNGLKEEKKKEYTPHKIDLENHKENAGRVYSINHNELKKLIKSSDKEYSIIYFNQIWCEWDLNGFNSLIGEDLEDFQLIPISALDWIFTKDYRR